METKVAYYLDSDTTPYVIKLPMCPENATLGDLKSMLKEPNCKYYFKQIDPDIGVVKEEISEDSRSLPLFKGTVVCWIVPKNQDIPDSSELVPRTSSTLEIPISNAQSFNSSSEFSDDESHFSSVTDTVRSRNLAECKGKRRREAFRPSFDRVSEGMTATSCTESSASLHVITVDLNLEGNNFLGISVVGGTGEGGQKGIFVHSIMQGGAVMQDGQIQVGDMLLEVNNVSFGEMGHAEAMDVLRKAVAQTGPIRLVVAKGWGVDNNEREAFVAPPPEPVRPIDPSAWVAHTQAMINEVPPPPTGTGSSKNNSGAGAGAGAGRTKTPTSFGSSTTLTNTTTSSATTLIPPQSEEFPCCLTVQTDTLFIVSAMAQPDSGLDVRNRMWLKITIPNSFLGSDVVSWLIHNVSGFADRREAKKYASFLLEHGFIRHTVNKLSFSEQCYYTFGDWHILAGSDLTDTDTLPPHLPPPSHHNQHFQQHQPQQYNAIPPMAASLHVTRCAPDPPPRNDSLVSSLMETAE